MCDHCIHLKEENEKLKTNQIFEASCTHLFEENEKLRERVAKMDEALRHCHDEIMDHVNRGQNCFHCKEAMTVAVEALADDVHISLKIDENGRVIPNELDPNGAYDDAR